MALAEQVLWLNQAQIRTATNAPPQHAETACADECPSCGSHGSGAWTFRQRAPSDFWTYHTSQGRAGARCAKSFGRRPGL